MLYLIFKNIIMKKLFLIAILALFSSCTEQNDEPYLGDFQSKNNCKCYAYHTHLSGYVSRHSFYYSTNCEKDGDVFYKHTIKYVVECEKNENK